MHCVAEEDQEILDLYCSGNEKTYPSLRTGKWTFEEEEYADKLIDAFQSGLVELDIADGKSMRSYLSNRLNCNPMRISKKFAGFEGLGSRLKFRSDNNQDINSCRCTLERLKLRFLEKDEEIQSLRKKKRKFFVSQPVEAFTVSHGGYDEKNFPPACEFDVLTGSNIHFCDDSQFSKKLTSLTTENSLQNDFQYTLDVLDFILCHQDVDCTNGCDLSISSST